MKFLRSLLLAALLCPPAALALPGGLPAFETVRAGHVSSDALLLDRHGQPLADLRLDPKIRRLDWVPLSALSPAMRDALLRAEDRRFFQHSGVDWLAFAGAAWQNLWGSGKRGASTLSMQLAGLLDPALRMPANRRSYAQKWDQSRAALELEEKWNKLQILEAYLNLAPFRGDLQGIGAASELIFQLPASQLGAREASLLAALLRGPNASPALVAKRACRLAATLGRAQLCNEITRLAQQRLDAPRHLPRHRLAPHLAQRVLQQGGQRVASLLDAGLQSRLLAALKPEEDPAVLLLDNASGEVLAWIGGRDPRGADGVVRPRLLPDWWWPAAAALALDQRSHHAASPLPLDAVIFDPRDARAAPASWLSLRAALPAHQPAALLGLHARQEREAWLERLRSLGFDTPEALPASPSLLQLAGAWRSFAAAGHWQAPRWLPGPEGQIRRVWRSETAFILQDILGQSGPAGWQASWSMRSPEDGAAVMVGHSERHTLAVAGQHADPQALWQRLLLALGQDSRPPAPPEGVLNQLVSFEPPLEAARREYFLRGTELSLVSVLPDRRPARIQFPEAGLSYPAPATPWVLQAAGKLALRWRHNGRPLGDGPQLLWQPAPGRHRLELLDPRERLLDSLEFEVLPSPTPP